MNQQIKTKYDTADELYDKAKEEMCKPEEDVVVYSACKNAYYSIVNYLSGFLMERGVKPTSTNIQDLINNCRRMDERFNELHLNPLYHPTQTEDVWMNLDAAKDYIVMAEKTRQMVLPVNQS